MPPDTGDRSPSLDGVLDRVAGDLFPSKYEAFGRKYVQELLNAIEAIPNPETRTHFTIQKFCNEIRRENGRIFEPTSIDLAGRYSNGIEETLYKLETEGVLSKRESLLDDLDADVYEIDPTYRSQVQVRDVYAKIAKQFFATVNPKNFFQTHDKERVLPWVTDEDAYIGTDPILHSRMRRGTVPRDNELMAKAKRTEPSKAVIECSNDVRPFAKLASTLVRTHKRLPSTAKRQRRTPTYKDRKSRFSVDHLHRYFEDDRVGNLVFVAGFFDRNAERGREDETDAWHLREHLLSTKTVRVEFDGELQIKAEDVYERSVGVLGILDENDGEPYVRTLSVLDSGRLPERIIKEQDRAREKLELELTRDIKEEQDRLVELVRKTLEEAELDEDDERRLEKTLVQLRTAVDDVERFDLLLRLGKDSPEVWDALRSTIEHL